MNHLVTKHILFEHFAGRATPLQRRMIEEWLRTPDHQELYYEWLEEWERVFPQYAAEEEQALKVSLQELDAWQQPALPLTHPGRNRFPFRWLSVAAAVVLVLGAGLWLGRNFLFYQTLETAYGEVREYMLPDSSVVVLNAHSSLRYTRFGFGTQGRRVELTGEANFRVRHMPDHQRFVVKMANNVEVVVLGTDFSVYSRPGGTRVVLNEGRVRVQQTNRPQANPVLMQPGDQVRLEADGKLSMRRVPHPSRADDWRDNRFVFDHTTMPEIAQLLQDNYGLQLSMADSTLAQRTVSGTFQAKTAQDMLQVLAELLEVNYRQQENIVTFFE
ncbi:hypothetical protein GCM10027347_28110 [Larkinella harenae]